MAHPRIPAPTRRTAAAVAVALAFTPVAGAQSTTSRSASLTSADGVRIVYDVQGQGSPALVFVHGWSCDRGYWAAQGDPFSRRHTVVTVDLAGHGDSGPRRGTQSIRTYGGDVAAVVRRLDLQRVVLIGHSMGGDVIVEAARQLSDRVAGLIWVDTYRDLSRPRTRDEIRAFIEKLRADFAGTTGPFVRGMFPEDADRTLVDRVANDMASAPAAIAIPSLQAAFEYALEIPAALRELKLPVIAINPEGPSNNVDAMKAHGVEVVLMPGVGHFLMMEAPERFNRLLEAAIERLWKR